METETVEKVESKTGELEHDDQIDAGQKVEEKVEKPSPETAEMRAAITELAGTVRELATPQEKQKELSQAEIDELWAVYDPKKTKADFMKKFFRLNDDATPEQEKEAESLFYEMRDGITKQAVTGSRHFLAIELDKMAKKFQPILDYVDKRQTEDLRERFFKTYEGLADPKYKKIIDAQAKILKTQGTEYSDESAYFKALAEGAADAIKELVPDFDLGKSKEKKPTATPQKLPRTTVGGGSSSGGEQQVSKSKDSIDDIEL